MILDLIIGKRSKSYCAIIHFFFLFLIKLGMGILDQNTKKIGGS